MFYLKHRRVQNVIGLEDNMPEQLNIIVERIKWWSCSLVKKDKKAHAERSVSTDERLNPEMFKFYFESSRVAHMRNLLDNS